MDFYTSSVNNEDGQITIISADRNILEHNRKTPIAKVILINKSFFY
ncbi:hypothetical protein [Clostridium chromiireducens]|nr:hypothetical protein [Clostridium chromiireducens]